VAWGGRGGPAGAEDGGEAAGLLGEEASRAEGVGDGDAMSSSARRRSAQTSVKAGKGRCLVTSYDMNWKCSPSPRRRFRTSVQS
jgi:hypothetical protein